MAPEVGLGDTENNGDMLVIPTLYPHPCPQEQLALDALPCTSSDLAGVIAGVVEYGSIRTKEKLGKLNAGGEVHVSRRFHNLLDTRGALPCLGASNILVFHLNLP